MKNNTNDKLLDSDEKVAEIESQWLTEAPQKRSNNGRDSKGRFTAGNNANPGGRPKLPKELKEFGEESVEKLKEIVADPKCSLKLKADIHKWAAEMVYGKAKQQVDLEGEVKNTGTTTVQFEGILEDWSK